MTPVKINMLLIVLILIITPSIAANESMTVNDIKNADAAIPFGVDFFTMLISATKWFAFFGFLVGITLVIAKGPIASALNNANMSADAQNGLFNIGKIMLLGAAVYIMGMYFFETYL